MLDFLGIGAKMKINQKMLEQNQIRVLTRQDMKIDKSAVLALTGSGKFYKGSYKNEHVSIKVVDISKEDSIINEFLLWQKFRENENFLKLFGVVLAGPEAYLIFEFFHCNLEYALHKKLLNEQAKVKVALNCLNILEVFQHEKKKTMDFRPGVFGVKENLKIKLLDFGIQITTDKFINGSLIERQWIKYQPPEYFNYQVEDTSYDIWSFGCLMIDIFSKEHQIFNQSYSPEEIQKMNEYNSFPSIPPDVGGVLKDIIRRCFERNFEKRIQIDELGVNLRIYFQNFKGVEFTRSNSISLECTEQFPNENGCELGDNSSNSQLNEYYSFIQNMEQCLAKGSSLITDDLMDHSILMKNSVENNRDHAVKKLVENYKEIEESLADNSVFSIEVLNQTKEKIIMNIASIQQYYKTALSSIMDAQNVTNEMRLSVNSLSKFANPEKYISLTDTLQKNQELLVDLVKNYSESDDFDKLIQIFEENKALVDQYKTLAFNKELLMQDILDVCKQHKQKFINASNIRELAQKLKIEKNNLKTDEMLTISSSRSIKDIYAKAQENSNIIVIYDMEQKKLCQIKLKPTDHISAFYPRSFSLYDRENKMIYVSGGVVKVARPQAYSDSFYQFQVQSWFDEYSFDFKELPRMHNCRASHSMIIVASDYVFVVSGSNTKSCEVFSKKANEWSELPELPAIACNASLITYKNALYVFSGSGNIFSTDGIYKLSLNNLDMIISQVKGFEDILQWESLSYKFHNDTGRLRRGMGVSINIDTVYLFGGFDIDQIYDNIYEIFIGDKPLLKQKSKLLQSEASSKENAIINKEQQVEDDPNMLIISQLPQTLPNKTFFSSNLLMLENYLIMVDAFNNAIEYEIQKAEFFYYT